MRSRDTKHQRGVQPSLLDREKGFTGHQQEDAFGLIDMQGRFYDPYQRRFMTPDPLVVDATSTQSWNAYSYVRNNPLNRVDPTGFADDYSDCHCPDYPDGHPAQPDPPATYVAGDPGGYGHDDLGYDPGDIGALGNEDRLAEFDNLGGELGPDFASGGNDGNAGVALAAAQPATWEVPAGIEIRGPTATNNGNVPLLCEPSA